MNIQELLHIVDGTLYGTHSIDICPLHSVTTDSRTISTGSVFFCIKGNHVDGHMFLKEAKAQGAVLAIIEQDVPSPPIPCIRVANTVIALGRLAHYVRTTMKHTVIGVTGSAGKTTTKELLAHVLSCSGTVGKNRMNYNNQIGMPLAIINARTTDSVWVLEVGISEAHDMQELGAILLPDIIYITNAGSAHTEGLGGKGVAYHKAFLAHYIQKGTSLYNGKTIMPQVFSPANAQELIQEVQQHTSAITLFSASTPCTVLYKGIDSSTTYGIYALAYKGIHKTIRIPYTGGYMAETISGVISVCLHLGCEFSEICSALETVKPVQQRNVCIQHNGSYIVDDTYNANPISMRAMVESIYSYPTERIVLILGDMKELGSTAESEHYALGKYIATKALLCTTTVMWKGEYASSVQQGLCDGGYTGIFIACPTIQDIEVCAHACSSTTTAILCKGSRSLHLEKELHILYTALGVSRVI